MNISTYSVCFFLFFLVGVQIFVLAKPFISLKHETWVKTVHYYKTPGGYVLGFTGAIFFFRASIWYFFWSFLFFGRGVQCCDSITCFIILLYVFRKICLFEIVTTDLYWSSEIRSFASVRVCEIFPRDLSLRTVIFVDIIRGEIRQVINWAMALLF